MSERESEDKEKDEGRGRRVLTSGVRYSESESLIPRGIESGSNGHRAFILGAHFYNTIGIT